MYNWLKKLIDVTYDVDDECKTDAALRCSSRILTPCSGYTIKEFMTGSVPYFFCSQPTSLSRCTIAKRVQSFIHRFDEIAKQRSQFHLNPYVTAADVQLGSRQLRETTSYADEPAVYGRDEDMDYIVNLLLNDADGNDREERDVSVCAIVGMGGLGKTTLAQKVYHDIRSTDYFEVKCWICVSDNFNPKIFVKTILESLGDEVAHDKHTMDLLQSRLQKRLDGKRFLVVLDDVSSEDQGPWETLRTSLCCGRKGSFIVVTTRLQTVASIMSTLPHYSPNPLSEEDCWTLFKQRAFMCNEEKNYPELEAVGMEIVKKCCGIPLAAKALGGLLRFKREKNQWLNVKDSQIWKLYGDALPALQLSYKHLSSQLKQCFAYCSIYPKHYQIKKRRINIFVDGQWFYSI
ncbi:putative disease resistance protein RGA3 [Papaver somniferum]|uniref:putative disease resistance protein RGA3 n=1 Tax=Papaver somniferum TaxID=3469 RepID=UPI000E704B09|nr:putative disease resistance protein RGA3 [Papaver somniferum]